MREKENRVELVNIIMLAILLALLVLGNFLPAFAIILLLSIIPMVAIGMSSNELFKSSALLLSVGIVLAVFGKEAALRTFLIYILPAFISSIVFLNENVRLGNKKAEQIFKGMSDGYVCTTIRSFLIAIIAFMIGAVAYFAAMKYMMNIDIISIMQDRIKDIVQMYKEALKNSNVASDNIFEQLIDNTATIIIVSIFIKSVISAIVAYFFAIPIINQFYKKKVFSIYFDYIVLPGNPVLVTIITLVTLYVVNIALPDMDMSMIINNFVFVMNILFFLEGISLIVFVVKRWSTVKKNVNWILMIGITIFLGVLPGISILGMLDNVWDYRRKIDPSINKLGGKNE